jgi:hypothetical protein
MEIMVAEKLTRTFSLRRRPTAYAPAPTVSSSYSISFRHIISAL